MNPLTIFTHWIKKPFKIKKYHRKPFCDYGWYKKHQRGLNIHTYYLFVFQSSKSGFVYPLQIAEACEPQAQSMNKHKINLCCT